LNNVLKLLCSLGSKTTLDSNNFHFINIKGTETIQNILFFVVLKKKMVK